MCPGLGFLRSWRGKKRDGQFLMGASAFVKLANKRQLDHTRQAGQDNGAETEHGQQQSACHKPQGSQFVDLVPHTYTRVSASRSREKLREKKRRDRGRGEGRTGGGGGGNKLTAERGRMNTILAIRVSSAIAPIFVLRQSTTKS